MHNVIFFYRNTENVYIHTISIKTFMRVHEFDFASLVFLLYTMKRSWNLCISHVLKWQNDGAQLYLLSDDVFAIHAHACTNTHTIPYICYIQWLLFIGHFIYCFVWNEIFWPFELLSPTNTHKMDPCGWHSFLVLLVMECGF